MGNVIGKAADIISIWGVYADAVLESSDLCFYARGKSGNCFLITQVG